MKIKKLFPVKKMTKKRLLEFLDKRGFYIVLILCIAIVGVTAVFLTTQNFGTPENEFLAQGDTPDEPNTGVSLNTNSDPIDSNSPQSSISSPLDTGEKGKVVDKEETSASGDTNTNVKKNENKNQDKNNEGKPRNNKETSKVKETAIEKFILPVFGKVIFEFAEDKLVYSPTLEDWRTHSGVDLAADRGTPVKAVADGIVYEVKNDPRFGITILLDHQNGIKTVYSNLASDKTVVPNQKIKQGDIIGSIGNTSSFESAEQPHLHFEVLKNNIPVNPSAYLPESK